MIDVEQFPFISKGLELNYKKKPPPQITHSQSDKEDKFIKNIFLSHKQTSTYTYREKKLKQTITYGQHMFHTNSWIFPHCHHLTKKYKIKDNIFKAELKDSQWGRFDNPASQLVFVGKGFLIDLRTFQQPPQPPGIYSHD